MPASTGLHHTVDIGRNIGVGGGWCNAVRGLGGCGVIVFKVFVKVGVAFLEFEVDVDINFGWVGIEVEDGEDYVEVYVS